MRPKWKKRLPFLLLVIPALYVGTFKVLMPRVLPTVRPMVEETAAQYINGKLHIDRIEVSPDLTFRIKDSAIYDRAGILVAKIPEVAVRVNPLNLLLGHGTSRMVSLVAINNPTVYMVMDSSDRWNVENLIKKSESSSEDFRGLVTVNRGSIQLSTPYGTWHVGASGSIDLVHNPVYGLDMDLTTEKGETLQLIGSIKSDGTGEVSASTETFCVTPYAALVAHYAPIADLAGTLSKLSVTWRNDDQESKLSGSVKADSLSLSVHKYNLLLPLTAVGTVHFDNKDLAFTDFTVSLDRSSVTLNGGLDLTDAQTPVFHQFAVKTDDFDLDAIPLDLPLSGRVTASASLDGSFDSLLAAGTVDSPALTVKGYEIDNLHLPLSAQGTQVNVTDGTFYLAGGKGTLTASYDTQDRTFAATLKSESLDLGAVAPDVGSIVLSGDLYAEGRYDDDLFAHVLSDDLSLTVHGLSFTHVDLGAVYEKGRLTLDRFAADSENGGSVTGSGSLEGSALKGNFYVTDLPVEPILASFGEEGEGLLSAHMMIEGTTDDPEGTAAFSLKDVSVKGFIAKEAHGLVSWKDRVVRLTKVELDPPQGRHELDGSVVLTGDDPWLDLTVVTKGVRLEPFSDAFALPLPVTGNLTNTVHVTGTLKNPNITGHVRAYDGSVNKFLVDELSGDYSVNDGAITMKNFKLQALTSTATFAGTIAKNGDLALGIDAYGIMLQRLPWLKEAASLQGSVNFNGAVSGNLSNPLFTGVLSSNSVIINGEEFTGLALSIDSTGGKINELEGSFQQKSGGDYFLSAHIDLLNHYYQWKAEVERGNVRSLLKMGGYDLDIDGFLSGTIALNPNGRRTGLAIKGKVEDGKVQGVPFDSADFDIFGHLGVWHINQLQAFEKGGGLFAAQGEVDMKNRTLDLEVAANGISPKILTVSLDDPPEIGGALNMAAQVKGPFDDPNGNFSLEVTGGSVSGVTFDSIYGMATLRDGMFTLNQFLVQRGIYKLSAYGTLPLDLLRAKENRRNPDAQMNLDLHLDNANLDILPTLTKYVQWATGPMKGNLNVSGTLEDYTLDGAIRLDDGTIKLRGMNNTIDHVKLDTEFAGTKVNLKELSAVIGDHGSVMASGSYELHGGESPYALTAAIRDVFIDSRQIGGKVNGDISVTQKNGIPFVAGALNLEDLYIGLTSVPSFGSGGSPIGLDFTVDLGEKMHLHTASFYDIWGGGKIHLGGTTADPDITGAINLTKGTLNYLNTPFRMGRSIVTWPERGTFTPHLDMKAFTRLGQYMILATIEGPLSMDGLQVHLKSDPPKDENTLKRFLTLKTDNADLTNNDWMGLIDAGIQLSYLSDVEDAIKQALQLDELRVYSGSLQSGIGFSVDAKRANEVIGDDRRQYNWLVAKSFGDKLRLGYTASFDGEDSSIFAEYFLNRRLNLSVSVDEENRAWYGVQYHTRF